MSNSTIQEVFIYRGGAYVKRNGTLSLKQGKQTLTIDTLPNTINPTTVRLSLTKEAKGNNVQVELLKKEERDELLKEIQRKVNEIDYSIKVKETQIDLWNKNGDFSSSQTIDIAQMSEYIEKLPTRLTTLYKEVEDLREEKKKIEKDFKDQQKQVSLYQVKADIEVEKDGTYPFELKYFENDSYWTPFYEIHSHLEEDLSLKLRARIYQNTNEEWKDVKVTLYSGNPHISLDLPKLDPTKLSYAENYFRKNALLGSVKMAGVMEEAMEDTMPLSMADTQEFFEASTTQGNASQTDTMMEYTLNGTWSINKDNPTIVDIYTKNVPCEYHIIAVPKLEDCGYLCAKVKAQEISEVLESSASIYHNDTFLGDLYLDFDGSSEDYEISLGRDETIRLKREQKKKYTSNVLLKAQKKTEYHYELTVTSNKNKPCEVVLYDQIPVSEIKEISVDTINLSQGDLDKETGEIKWNLKMEPNTEEKKTIEYTIQWPKDKTYIEN